MTCWLEPGDKWFEFRNKYCHNCIHKSNWTFKKGKHISDSTILPGKSIPGKTALPDCSDHFRIYKEGICSSFKSIRKEKNNAKTR